MSMKSITMMPPRSRSRIWRTISFTASSVRPDDRIFQAVRAFADEFAGVHVNRDERFGVVDDDVAARLEPYFRPQALVNFLLDAELLEYRRVLGVELHAVHECGLKAAHELHDFRVLLLGVHPDGGVIGAHVIAQNPLDQIQVAVQKRRRFALLRARLDFRPRAREEFHVGANFLRCRSCQLRCGR